MKKMMFSLIAILTIAVQANAMSYEQARNEALFLTDKMAYELNLSNSQYEAAYEINLDYLMGVTTPDDVYGVYWERRNMDLNYILYSWQWEAFRAANYFFRPLYWKAGYWHFGVYARYPHRDYFYFGRPHFYASYRGGHSWRMNGGRSFYEGRRVHYRPERPRDQHFGMRNGWDRGDYRGNSHGSSSTRYTERHDNGHNNGYHHDNRGGGSHGNPGNSTPNGKGYDRGGSGHGGNAPSGSRSNSSSMSSRRSTGSSTGSSSSVSTGSRNGGSRSGASGNSSSRGGSSRGGSSRR